MQNAPSMTIFGTKPKIHKSVRSPLEQGGHTYLDTSEPLDNEYNQKYQHLIGSLQWNIYLGRFDIYTHVMTIYRFISAPSQGQMDHVNRIYSQQDKMMNACIKLRT